MTAPLSDESSCAADPVNPPEVGGKPAAWPLLGILARHTLATPTVLIRIYYFVQ